MNAHSHPFDVVVIGSGFGGLGAALRMAEAGQRVALFEALSYPGGCASTFSRQGYRFEAGATLFAGLAEGQLLRQWVDRYAPELALHFPDPVVELRAPGLSLPISPRREELVERLAGLPGAPAERLRAFFDEQREVASALWELFADPGLLPPFAPGALLDHARRLPRYLPLLRLIGRPLSAALRRHGLEGFAPLRHTLDAVCQITVQASSGEAEAPFAMGAMDYYFRGAGHVVGGIGALAWALARAIEALGGEVFMASRVRGLQREGEGWRVTARGRDVWAPVVMANLLPQDLSALWGRQTPRLTSLARQVETGWGAAMLYLGVGPGASERRDAHHIELIVDPERPLIEGNHLFCSLSEVGEAGRAPPGHRSVTVSTHVPMKRLLALDEAGRAAYISENQRRMRAGLAAHLPALHGAIDVQLPASPRTFARFTGRHLGYVGGVPRLAGLHNYKGLFPSPIAPGLYLVGDSVFPGQSTLATAIGGVKAAEHWLGTGRGGLRAALPALPVAAAS